ncbi:maker740 [Drosophila busckii]|uniref:Maker740 n=1 Tax=Drosophila busckii TaxID=30019 RepID=A0A0M4EF90_DROBS|nr:maker740 [Drosophila busckii]
MLKLCITYSVLVFLALKAAHSALVETVTTSLIQGVLGNSNKSNIVFSPLLLQDGLKQLYIGAEGNTSAELENLLQYNGGYSLLSSYQGVQLPENVELNIASRLFVAKNVTVLKDYQENIKRLFNSTVEFVDFKDSAKASTIINSWVANQTRDKIPKLIEKTEASDVMMLLSAIYFKGLWAKPFDSKLTEKREFYSLDDEGKNKTIKVDTMYKRDLYRSHEIQELDARTIEIPYANTTVSMVILLPNQIDGIDLLVKNLESLHVDELLRKDVVPSKIALQLPKFKFDLSIELKPMLQELGVKELFKAANLTKITAAPVSVGSVFQKAVIEVDEKGATAAAAQVITATAVSVDTAKDFHVNRPFVFVITDFDKVYFAGRVGNPT